MQLLERESALATLADYAGEAGRGAGRLVLVAGEAGAGKSALLERFHDDVPDARWLWSACDGLFTPRPLGPLFDLAAQLGGELLELCAANAPREALFGALLRQIDEPGTLTVLVMDDLHWADEATLDLLRFLGRRIRDAAVLLVATYRDDGLTAADPLRLALGELASQGSTRRVSLPTLSEDAVGILAGESGLAAAELHALTGGNPFYVTAVVQAGVGEIPASARDAVLARVARLSPESRTVLDVAALIGTRIELPLLESVTSASPSLVDDLLASGLLAGDGGGLHFRHEIARVAVEQAIAAHRRGPIHARILDGLRPINCDDDARLAFHAEGAGDGAAVLQFAPRAARRATELASHRESATQYKRALRFASDEEPATVAALYDGLAAELALVDRWPDAAEAGERALALWRAVGNKLREGDMMRRFSRTQWRLCRGAAAVAAAEQALATLEPLGPSVELAWAYANLASQRMGDGQYADAIDLAQSAQMLAEQLGEVEVLVDALNTEGCSAAGLGREWSALMQRALDLAVSGGFQAQAGRAYTNIHGLYHANRRFEEGEQLFVAGAAYCDDHDIGTFGTCLRGERTVALEKAGRWDEAARLSVDLLRWVASPINRISPLVTLGRIRARRGEPGVWECLDEATEAADGTGSPQWIVPARLARAEMLWLDGQTSAARREVELAHDVSANCEPWDRGAIAVWLRRTGSSRAMLGDLAEPYRLQVAGDWQQAAALWTDLGSPFDAAMTLLDTKKEAPLREALSVFQDFGATATVRVARQRMRGLGVRSIPSGARAATRAHPLGLTPREHEVLDLICDGHTNAEIAARLFIASKTVDHHVSAVLAKLGAPTRQAAASEATRLGLVGAAET